MLSERDYQDLQWKLNHIPSSITGQKRQNLRTTFKKKIHEHHLASQYPPFQPLQFERFFVNFKTTDSTLNHLIEQVKTSTVFTLDTESVIIPYKPNKPALIQLQIILSESFSYVVIIEMCQLPSIREPTFQLIQKFFQTLFSADKNIFIWGEIDELHNFVSYQLFTYEQIHLCNDINLQNEFKQYWNEKHPHKITTSLSSNCPECICETCLGLQKTNTWSLQNAVAFELAQWLDKRHTKSNFDIGLDINLYHFNSDEITHRELLSRYAAYDCLSMQQLILKLNLIEKQESIIKPSDETITVALNELSDIVLENDQHDLPTERMNEVPNDPENELQTILSDDELLGEQQQLKPETLTKEQRKKIHNRSCTLKQRKKYYKCEIIRRNIDRRFTIRMIKNILRENNIQFTAVNVSTSSLTNKKSLYIGIKNQSKLKSYKNIAEELFTSAHYHQIKYGQHRFRSSNKDDRHTTYHTQQHDTKEQKKKT